MTRDARRLLKHRGSARCGNSLAAAGSRLKKILVERSNRRCGCLLSNDKKERTPHESYDNRTGNSLHSHKHVCAGASQRNGWVRVSRAAFSGFVCGSGGFDKCSPDVEEHWPSSASAERSYCRSLFREHLCAEPCTVQGSQVKEKPRICAGLFLTHSSWEM